MRVLLIK